MNRIKENLILIILLLIVLGLGLYVWGIRSYQNMDGNTADRATLIERFNNKENEFMSIIDLFTKNRTDDGNLLTFKSNKVGEYDILLNPKNLSTGRKSLIVSKAKIGDSQLDSLLNSLSWSPNILMALESKLNDINCNVIRETEIKGFPIEIYSTQNNSFSYLIFPNEPNDSILQIRGRPISGTEFGRRVFLEYTSSN